MITAFVIVMMHFLLVMMMHHLLLVMYRHRNVYSSLLRVLVVNVNRHRMTHMLFFVVLVMITVAAPASALDDQVAVFLACLRSQL
jgi:hypothetical protein